MDWFFVSLLVTAAGFWVSQTRPRVSLGLAGRILLGAMAALIVLVVLQVANNACSTHCCSVERARLTFALSSRPSPGAAVVVPATSRAPN